MSPKENVCPGEPLAHLPKAIKGLDSSEGNENRTQEDALPPPRRKESGWGPISPIERNVSAAWFAIVSRKVPTNSTPGEVGTVGLCQRK